MVRNKIYLALNSNRAGNAALSTLLSERWIVAKEAREQFHNGIVLHGHLTVDN